MSVTPRSPRSAAETRVLDAVKVSCERWGIDRVTVDDIAFEAGVSRATLYRMYPGGKDVLFEALRVRELEEFFTTLETAVRGAVSLEDLVVTAVVCATTEMRADDHLTLMLATEPGSSLGQLTVEGVPRIVDFATAVLVPMASPFLDEDRARPLVELLARLTISYFLAPSDRYDLGEPASARRLLAPIVAAMSHPDPSEPIAPSTASTP